MGYTQDEITAAVGKLLLSSVSYGIDLATNNRKVDATFNDVQESAATLCVMFPTAPLYIATLSVKSIGTGIARYTEQLTELIAGVRNLSRTTSRLNDLSSLAGMQSALLELGAVVDGGGAKNLLATPAYQRFTKNAAIFLAAAKPGLVSGGDVLPTKQQSMETVPAQLTALPGAFAALAQSIRYFANGMADYTALNLPQLLTQNVVARAYQLIATRYIAMSGLSDYDRQTVLRDAVLEVISSNSILASLASFGPPPLYPTVSAMLQPYADADHLLSTPGTIKSLTGPFILRYGDNDVLTLAVNVPAVTLDIRLNSTVSTYLDGTVAAPFNVRAAAAPAVLYGTVAGPFIFISTDTLSFLLECPQNGSYQSWRVDVAIPAGGPYSLADIAGRINTAITDAIGSALFVADGTGRISIASVGTGAGQHIMVLGGVAARVIGFTDGQAAFGTSPTDTLYFTHTASSTDTPTTFAVTLAPGYQIATAVVDTVNAAVPAELSGKLHAAVQSYAVGAVTQQYVRIILDDPAATATLTVSGTADPNGAGASVVGLHGTVGHQAQTVAMLADFLNQYADAQHKLSNYLVASVVDQRLQLRSRADETVGSQIVVSGTAATTLFGTTAAGYGSAQWYVMSADNPAIAEGDIVELHSGATIMAKVLSRAVGNLLYLSAPSACNVSYTFGTAGPAYAVVKQGGQASYSDVVANTALTNFLADSHTAFFSNLTRYANMMLVDKNPSEAEITTVTVLLQSHLAEIQAIWMLLQTFSAPVCPAVDQLVRQLQEKGADKAVDTLAQCRFSEFFNLDLQTSSYTGAVMAGLQTVVQQDLPVSKYDRIKGARQVLATTQSPDYDGDFSDAAPDIQKYTADKA